MDATVQKWGNSLALRIPKSIAKDARLEKGSVVELTIVGGDVVLKSKRKKYTLAELLKGMTKKNLHPAVDWGPPKGREVW